MEGTPLNAGEQYVEREKRVMDTVALQQADRVPLATLSDFFLVRSQGLTCAEAMYDHAKQKHREVLGNTACFWGDIPGGLLVTGTPDQVRDHVKELIDDFPDGGLIVDGASNGIPMEARKENVMAVTETVMEYGRY